MRLLFVLNLLSVALYGTSFESPVYNFKFDYNDSLWEVVPSRTEKTDAQQIDKSMAQQTLATVQRKQPDEKYHARFHVVSDSLEKFKDSKVPQLVQYQKHTVDFLKSQRFMILSQEPVQLPLVKETAVEILANQRDFGLKFKQVIFIHEGRVYILTATTRTEKFDDYKSEIKAMFDSFQFGKEVKK
ncbi:MAG: PsbP-related protein [Deltaproteobacteria bacterium]